MTLIAATVLALLLQPVGERPAPPEPVLLAREHDAQLDLILTAIIASAVIGPDGEVVLSYPLSDRRFLRPNSGYYWQISAAGHDDFPSRSLWDRKLKVSGRMALGEPFYYDSTQFPSEPLRVAERTVSLPNSDVEWQFVVARSRADLD